MYLERMAAIFLAMRVKKQRKFRSSEQTKDEKTYFDSQWNVQYLKLNYNAKMQESCTLNKSLDTVTNERINRKHRIIFHRIMFQIRLECHNS